MSRGGEGTVFLYEAEFESSLVWDISDSSVLEFSILVLALSEGDLFGLADTIFQQV